MIDTFGRFERVIDENVLTQINDNKNLIIEYQALINDLNSIIHMLEENSGDILNCYNCMLDGLMVKDTSYIDNLNRIKGYGTDFSLFAETLSLEIDNTSKEISKLEELNASLEANKYKWIWVPKID